MAIDHPQFTTTSAYFSGAALDRSMAAVLGGLFSLVSCVPTRDTPTPRIRSMINVPQQQVPGLFHRRVGDIIVTAVSDGFLDASIDMLRNLPREEIARILAENFRPARRTAVNAFLVYSAGRLALIDTGCGGYLTPTTGKLLANLKAAGVDPADIDIVL